MRLDVPDTHINSKAEINPGNLIIIFLQFFPAENLIQSKKGRHPLQAGCLAGLQGVLPLIRHRGSLNSEKFQGFYYSDIFLEGCNNSDSQQSSIIVFKELNKLLEK